MDENGKQSSGLSWSGLVTIFLLFAGAVLVQQIPLQSSRPAEIESSLRLFENPQIVRARLWEDPFGAIARHVQEQSTKHEKSETAPKLGPQSKFCNSPEDGSGKNSKGPVDVLGVMVFGGDTEPSFGENCRSHNK